MGFGLDFFIFRYPGHAVGEHLLRLLPGFDLLPDQIDEAVQNCGMRGYGIVIPAVESEIIDGFREIKRERPVLIRIGKAAVPGFHLDGRRQHKADALRTVSLHDFINGMTVQTETVEIGRDGLLDLVLAVDIREV